MIHDVATGKYVCKPYRLKTSSTELNSAIEKLSNEIRIRIIRITKCYAGLLLRLLEGDQSIIDAIRSGDLGNLKKDFILSEVED